jgi:hypothetical protein
MNSRHHINCRSRLGTNHADNISIIEVKVHQRLHALFDNMLFHEQIDFLKKIASPALAPNFREDLEEILD